MKKIAIFGSTGMTGLCATRTAIKKGLNVKVLVRDPKRLPKPLRDNVEVVQGNILNYDEVLKAVQNTDAVLLTLGTRNDLKPTTDLSEGLKNIVKAMKQTNIEVISCLLSYYLFFDPKKVPRMFRDINDEHQRMLDVLKESGLKYIAVNAPYIVVKPESTYVIAHDTCLEDDVSLDDLARFMVESLDQPEHYGQVCGITSK